MKQETTADPDGSDLNRLYPTLMKVGDPYDMESGLMKGKGTCIRRKLTPRGGVLFTILFTDGRIQEWEWFD